MNHSLEQLLVTQSFVLWIKDESSLQETKYWVAWLSEHSSHKELAREAGEIVEAVHSQYEILDPEAELQKLSREIRRRKRSHPSLPPSYSSRSVRWQRAGIVAAGFIFMLALLGGIFAYQYGSSGKDNPEKIATSKNEFTKEYTTGYGEKVTFRLSDGSNIILNAIPAFGFPQPLKRDSIPMSGCKVRRTLILPTWMGISSEPSRFIRMMV